MISKPEKLEDHEWYFVPKQKPSEVLGLSLRIRTVNLMRGWWGACGHGSPFILGTEGEEARESIEARVLAFW